MGKFTVKKKICKKCADCVTICPTHILTVDEDHFPMPKDDTAWERCMGCGHCVAICPTSALSVPNVNIDKSPALIPIYPYTQEKLLQLFSHRRSVRQYRNKVISKNDLQELFELTELAPSARNIRPTKWISLSGRKVLDEVIGKCADTMRKMNNEYLDYFVTAYENGQDFILRGCTNVAIAYGPEENPWTLTDGVISTTHLELASSLKGFGACWAGLLLMCIAENKDLRKLIGLQEKMIATGALMLGYPKLHFHHIPERQKPNVHWIH